MIAALSLACQILLGTAFVVAAVTKLRDTTRFMDSLSSLELLPRAMLRPLSVAIPLVELAGAVATLWGYGEWGPMILVLLLAGFSGTLLVFRSRGGTEYTCGCFGGAQSQITVDLILRNCLLLMVAVPLFLAPDTPASVYDVVWGSLCAASMAGIWVLGVHILTTARSIQAERRFWSEYGADLGLSFGGD